MRGGSVLATGDSKLLSNPAQCEFLSGMPKPKVSLHAEIDALKRCGNSHKATLFIARIGRNDKIGMAKPCQSCQDSIKKSGIKRVIYTVNNETYSVWTPK